MYVCMRTQMAVVSKCTCCDCVYIYLTIHLKHTRIYIVYVAIEKWSVAIRVDFCCFFPLAFVTETKNVCVHLDLFLKSRNQAKTLNKLEY